MGDGTRGSPEEESSIEFPGALSQSDRAKALNPDVIAQHEIDSEEAYKDLNDYLNKFGKDYYQALSGVADRMNGWTTKKTDPFAPETRRSGGSLGRSA